MAYTNPDLMQEEVIKFAMRTILTSTESQEVEHAIADNDRLRDWLQERFGDNALTQVQRYIRVAENRLGDRLPPNYG